MTDSRRLAGQVALVTGAGGAIGRAEALALAREGAKIVVNDVANAEATVDMIIAAGGEAVANGADLSSWRGGGEAVQAALDQFGRIDILVNNAGTVRPGFIHELTEEDWDAVLNVHLKGYAATIHAVAPHFITQRSGVIVNTGSGSGLGHVRMTNYSAAKEGVLGLTRSIARELGQYGIRCNLVRPVSVVSGLGTPAVLETMEMSSRLGLSVNGLRFMVLKADRTMPTGDPVGALVTLLCLPATAHVSGQDFFIMGDEVGRFPEPDLRYTQFQPGGWTLDALETPEVLDNLIGDIRNRYVHPL